MIEDPETAAILVGLLAAMTFGAVLLIGHLAIEWWCARKFRADPYDQVGPIIHPADDVHDLDSWPLMEQFLEQRPGLREQYEREAMEHRERKGK